MTVDALIPVRSDMEQQNSPSSLRRKAWDVGMHNRFIQTSNIEDRDAEVYVVRSVM